MPAPFFFGRFFRSRRSTLWGRSCCMRATRDDRSAASGLLGRSWCTRGKPAGGYRADGWPIAGLLYGLRGPQISRAIEGCGLRRFEWVGGPRTKRFSAMGGRTRVAIPHPVLDSPMPPLDQGRGVYIVCGRRFFFYIHGSGPGGQGGGPAGWSVGVHVQGTNFAQRYAGKCFRAWGIHPRREDASSRAGGRA